MLLERGEDATTRGLADRQRQLERLVAEYEGKAVQHRRLLAEVTHDLALHGDRVGRLCIKIRSMADPRIATAQIELRNIADKARGKFVSWTEKDSTNPLRRARQVDRSNGDTVAEVMAAANGAHGQLEELKFQPRQADLEPFIQETVEPVRQPARRTLGIAAGRERSAPHSTGRRVSNHGQRIGPRTTSRGGESPNASASRVDFYSFTE